MGGKGGGGSNIDYAQSPEQRQVFQAAMPNLQRLFQGGNIYDIPGIEGITPGPNWYQNLSPEIKSGIQSPYIDASRQLFLLFLVNIQPNTITSPYTISGANHISFNYFSYFLIVCFVSINCRPFFLPKVNKLFY